MATTGFNPRRPPRTGATPDIPAYADPGVVSIRAGLRGPALPVIMSALPAAGAATFQSSPASADLRYHLRVGCGVLPLEVSILASRRGPALLPLSRSKSTRGEFQSSPAAAGRRYVVADAITPLLSSFN